LKEFLSENGIEFEYVDITDSMRNLKIYLRLRDTRPEFDEIKKIGRVGIPFIMINNGESLIFETPEINELKKLLS
jgi:glutaredoxin-related protein